MKGKQMIPSTKKQRQLIGIACNQMGIDKETKAVMLTDRFGQSSTTLISQVQADLFLRELKKKGFATRYVPRKKRQTIPRDKGKTICLVSRGELDKITAVAALIPWRAANGLQLWMEKRLKIKKVRTAGDAYRVIEGLKKMFENGMKKKHGPDWWTMIFDDPDIETYIRTHCPKDYSARMWAARFRAGVLVPNNWST
jgi:hypothetical protein